MKEILREIWDLINSTIGVVVVTAVVTTSLNVFYQKFKIKIEQRTRYQNLLAEEIAKALSHLKAVAILDKADSLNGAGGALYTDVTSAMYENQNKVLASSYIYGIGGRDTTTKEIKSVFEDLMEDSKKDKIENPYRYLGLRKE